MVAPPLSFLTPYWSGTAMMRLHLASIRQFHPDAPILISKRGDAREMEHLQREFGIDYWIDDCGYTDAYLRLLKRCQTPFICIADHDVVLLSSIDALVRRVASGEADLVGVEERIRVPDWLTSTRWPGGWLRFAPGCTASNFLILDWQSFERRWGLLGIFGTPTSDAHHFDFDYGIGQRLTRHCYLRPYHAAPYGLGNVLKDGEVAIAWHQWYGSFRTRLNAPDESTVQSIAETGEQAFLRDYPRLDFRDLSPAWGPGCPPPPSAEPQGLARRARQRAGYRWRALTAQIAVALERPSRGVNRA